MRMRVRSLAALGTWGACTFAACSRQSASAFVPPAPRDDRAVNCGPPRSRAAAAATPSTATFEPPSPARPSASSSSTALSLSLSAAAFVPPVLQTAAAAGASVAAFYRANPLLAGFLTASTKACVADTLAQKRDVCTEKFDVRRNLAMVLYSGLVLGMSVEVMYNRIFPLLFGSSTGIVRVMQMTLFDGFVNAPLLWLPPAYLAQALLYGYPKRQAIRKYATDVRENGLLMKYWSLWLPMSTINFLWVPKHFRVAFVACVSFFWMIILSLVANKGGREAESCPVEPEPVMLNPRALD
ncbi:hypothetical protein ACHAWF_005191 [Thalassiosira exigua]